MQAVQRVDHEDWQNTLRVLHKCKQAEQTQPTTLPRGLHRPPTSMMAEICWLSGVMATGGPVDTAWCVMYEHKAYRNALGAVIRDRNHYDRNGAGSKRFSR